MLALGDGAGWVLPIFYPKSHSKREKMLSQPQPACMPPAFFSLTQAFAGEAGVMMPFSRTASSASNTDTMAAEQPQESLRH